MINWSTLGVAVLSNIIVVGGLSWFIKKWVGSKFDERLAEFQSGLDKKNFISNSLYKNRESTILEFDLVCRGFAGSCRHLIDDRMQHQSEFDYRWKKLRENYSRLQTAYFRGGLLFEEELLNSSETIMNICNQLEHNSAIAITMLAGEAGYTLDGVDGDPDFAWDVNEFLPVRDEITLLLNTVSGHNLDDWQSNARDALLHLRVPGL